MKPEDAHDDPLVQARAYLAGQFGDRAPAALEHVAQFDGEPLEGEGATTLFRFNAAPDGGEPRRFWVAAGRTQPNYYPDCGLDAQDMYCLHLGTRFMLVIEVSQLPPDRVPANAEAWFKEFLARLAPGAVIESVDILAAFAVGEEIYAVARARVAGETIIVFGIDAPPGVCRETHLPPHILIRRHVGRLILREWEEERRKPRRRTGTTPEDR